MGIKKGSCLNGGLLEEKALVQAWERCFPRRAPEASRPIDSSATVPGSDTALAINPKSFLTQSLRQIVAAAEREQELSSSQAGNSDAGLFSKVKNIFRRDG